jgi:hypothetical protein
MAVEGNGPYRFSVAQNRASRTSPLAMISSLVA